MSQKDLEKEVLEEISAEETNDEILPESDKEENQEEVLEASTRKVRVKLNVDYRTLKYYNVYVLKYVRKFYWLYAIFLLLLIGGIVYSVIVKTYVVVALMAVFALYLVISLSYILLTIFNASLPDILMIDIAPTPRAVEIATIVSSILSLLYFLIN